MFISTEVYCWIIADEHFFTIILTFFLCEEPTFDKDIYWACGTVGTTRVRLTVRPTITVRITWVAIGLLG